MSLDPKILRRAVVKLNEKKDTRAFEIESRRKEVYRRIPRIEQIDSKLKNTMIDLIGQTLKKGEDPLPAINNLKEKNLDFQVERAELLVSFGYPIDYLDDKPECRKCGDTGYTGNSLCSCLHTLYNEEQIKELSNLLKLGEQRFDYFNLDYYDRNPDPGRRLSPYDNMELIYEACVKYVREFGGTSTNLFFYGGTGLGKTFLSACIAREVSQQGFSVVYDTAVSIFEKFEIEKFSKEDDLSESRADINRYLTCDLFIIDDLGTEMTTQFVSSALYTIINTRLMTNKKTIINTNLSIKELRLRYSPQVISRIEGEYAVSEFFGTDIRQKKKAEATKRRSSF